MKMKRGWANLQEEEWEMKGRKEKPAEGRIKQKEEQREEDGRRSKQVQAVQRVDERHRKGKWDEDEQGGEGGLQRHQGCEGHWR